MLRIKNGNRPRLVRSVSLQVNLTSRGHDDNVIAASVKEFT